MNNENRDEVVYLYLDDIIPNRFQPREVFDEKALKELAVSIKEHGVIQPIIVRNVNGKYEIIAGERRYKATALAGLTKIPAIIRNLDDKESSKVALLENLQRKNLSPIEEARTYQKILEIDQMTQEELAKTMGKSQSSVANKLRLLSLPDEIQDALLKEQISERHARSLLSVQDPKKQKELLKKIVSNKMSVKVLEDEIKQMYPKEETQADVSLQSDFVNSNPLMPTTDISLSSDNYGKVRIAPPDEDKQEGVTPKFINYGEVDSDDETTDSAPSQLNLNSTIENIDVNEVLNKTSDINENTNQDGGLDSLLNIGSNSNGPSVSGGEYKYLTPAEGIVKQDIEIDNPVEGDYFKPIDNEKFTNNNTYTLDQAVNIIRETIEDLKNHGVEINIDEMDFEKTYQIIIKLNK